MDWWSKENLMLVVWRVTVAVSEMLWKVYRNCSDTVVTQLWGPGLCRLPLHLRQLLSSNYIVLE